MRFIIILFFPFISIAISKVIKPADTLAYGQWHSEAHFKLNGIPMPPSHDENCVTESEAKDPKKTIEESLKRNDCKLITWDMKKQTVNATVTCENEQYHADGKITGTFTKKEYNLSGIVTGKHRLLGHARANVQLLGKWIGSCKK